MKKGVRALFGSSRLGRVGTGEGRSAGGTQPVERGADPFFRVAAALALTVVAACGQKGPLVLPGETPPGAPAPAAEEEAEDEDTERDAR